MIEIRPGEKPGDRPVLSGTPTPVLSGTLFPTYRERSHGLTIGAGRSNSASSNLANTESFGLLLTRPQALQGCGRSSRNSIPFAPPSSAERAVGQVLFSDRRASLHQRLRAYPCANVQQAVEGSVQSTIGARLSVTTAVTSSDQAKLARHVIPSIAASIPRSRSGIVP
jgi:hypothetical protein